MKDKKFKKCTKCKKTKPISEFLLDKYRRFRKKINKYKDFYYYSSRCKLCKKAQFKKMKPPNKSPINPDGTPKWSRVRNNLMKKSKKLGIIFDLQPIDFNRWVENQKDECFYCRLSLKESKKIMLYYFKKQSGPITKSPRFQIDRKEPKKGYTIENICFACGNCNKHKSDFFSDYEFKEISKKYLKPKFKKILNYHS